MADAEARTKASGRQSSTLRGTEILTLIRRLCAPLAYLHGQGLIHRDLKPRNILLRNQNDSAPGVLPVLVDFGLAAEFGGAVARATLEVGGVAVGTLAYSAPEQLEGRLVDARADLYALGSMLCSLMTGRPVFGTLAEVLDPEIHAVAPSSFVSGIPDALDELVLGLLAKTPAQRIGHADLVATALADLGGRNGAPPGPAPRVYLYRPALTGRTDVLQRLGRTLSERLRGGRGILIFLGGESGIGKTRLAIEVASRFQRQGIDVLTGECAPGSVLPLEGALDVEHRSGGGAPFQPLADVLQAIADRCREQGEQETARLLGTHGALLARYEPALRDVPGHETWLVPERLPADQARLRLFRQLGQTLSELGIERRPMIHTSINLSIFDNSPTGRGRRTLHGSGLAVATVRLTAERRQGLLPVGLLGR